jgi:thioredoxin-like negative regulator of GroEL
VPSDSADADAYRRAWSALYTLMYEGMSFSGREKNCAFLNTGDGLFADASALTGLGSTQDGRAYAVTDWDSDGAPDLWLASRNAPQLRLMRNRGAEGAHFVALRLEGRSCNRDAIGARVEVVLAGGERHVRTLHAGDGYLAQSSKWLHVGLGASTEIEHVVVRWPGAEAETFTGVAADGFWHVVQGEAVRRWSRPAPATALAPSTLEAAVASEKARVALAMRVPAPRLDMSTPSGETVRVRAEHEGPVLVNLWASWCAPCVAELGEMTARADELRERGLEVVAVSVDEEAKRAEARALLERLDWPFQSGDATPELLETLDAIQRQLVYRKREMPVPTSFLINAAGQLAYVYKGPVDVDVLLDDLEHLGGSPADVRRRGVPFTGRWQHDPVYPLPVLIALAEDLFQRDLPLAASDVLRRVMLPQGDPSSAEMQTARGQILAIAQPLAGTLLQREQWDEAGAISALVVGLNPGDLAWHRALAGCFSQLGRHAEAAAAYRRALTIAPDKMALKVELAQALGRSGDTRGAVRVLEEAVAGKPKSVQARLGLAVALDQVGRRADALVHLRRALEIKPEHAEAQRMLAAWGG